MMKSKKSNSDYKHITISKNPNVWDKLKQRFDFSNFKNKPKKQNINYGISKKRSNSSRLNTWENTNPSKDRPNKNKAAGFLGKILTLLLAPLLSLGVILWSSIKVFFARENVLRSAFVLMFVVICFNFARLQVFTNGEQSALKNDVLVNNLQIIQSRRGQIFIVDLQQNQGQEKKYIPATATQNLANLFFNPSQLKKYLNEGMKLEDVVSVVAGSLNLSYNDLYNLMKTETDIENPKKYVLIEKFISENQKAIVQYLSTEVHTRKIVLASGLGIEEQEIRSYPQGRMLASVLGYVPKQQVPRSDALLTGCKASVLENERRGTVQTYIPGDFSKAGYTVGYYGLEQKFCSQLEGLNGRKTLNNELSNEKLDETKVVNGADIYTTIDRNIQLKAEQVLADAVKRNSNANGSPKNGAVVVMEANTGKILAMASSPTYDPEKYSEADPNAYRNIATLDYEVGSVMKPLTVAAAINEYQSGNLNSKGGKLGVPPDFQFEDYPDGKIYSDNSGEQFVIRNSQGKSYKNMGRIGLDTCLVFSINTCISEVTDSLGTRVMQQYFSEKYLFGKNTALNLPGDGNGNVSNLEREINHQYSYAQIGFGQGILISPIQLLRGYTAIANNGLMVDPYLVEKIKYADGTEDTGTSPDSVIKRNTPSQVLKESASRIVTDYMIQVIQRTSQGVGANKANVPGFTIAGKTGTAEKITNIKGSICNYICNREKGLYEHTFVGFNVNSKNKILVLVKLDEPKPGEVTNFSGDTVGPSFSEMMGFTLNYLGIKEDK